MADLLVIVPSRGRPGNIAELLEAWGKTVKGDTGLLVAVDEDDPELSAYQDVCRSVPLGFRPVIGPRERLGPTLNRLAIERAPDHFAIGFMGDDHRPRTPGWDTAMVDALREMGAGLVYGDDLIQHRDLPTAVVMTANIVRALGWFAPPGLTHMYLDNAWLALGEALGRIRYLPGVVIEHCHPVGGTAAWDAGYAEVNSPERYAADEAAFRRWLEEDFASDVARVEEAIRGCA